MDISLLDFSSSRPSISIPGTASCRLFEKITGTCSKVSAPTRLGGTGGWRKREGERRKGATKEERKKDHAVRDPL